MVTATIEIYETVQRELLPTPEKPHYTYNLRDLGKVNKHNVQVFDIQSFAATNCWYLFMMVKNRPTQCLPQTSVEHAKSNKGTSYIYTVGTYLMEVFIKLSYGFTI